MEPNMELCYISFWVIVFYIQNISLIGSTTKKMLHKWGSG